jgi:predicted HicB family RNase H-like nuclease
MAPKSKRVLPGKRYPLNMRTTKELRDKIEWAATVSGRSLVQELEFRVERSFQEEEIEKSTGTVKLLVWLPERIHGRLEAAAKHNDWSINTEIFDRLDVSFQLEDRKKMEEQAEREGVQGLQDLEEIIQRAVRARDLLAAQLSKSEHESPPKGEDSK